MRARAHTCIHKLYMCCRWRWGSVCVVCIWDDPMGNLDSTSYWLFLPCNAALRGGWWQGGERGEAGGIDKKRFAGRRRTWHTALLFSTSLHLPHNSSTKIQGPLPTSHFALGIVLKPFSSKHSPLLSIPVSPTAPHKHPCLLFSSQCKEVLRSLRHCSVSRLTATPHVCSLRCWTVYTLLYTSAYTCELLNQYNFSTMPRAKLMIGPLFPSPLYNPSLSLCLAWTWVERHNKSKQSALL